MMHLKVFGALTALAISLATLGGCCDAEKKQLADLNAKYGDLQKQNDSLRGQITSASAADTDNIKSLEAQLAQKDIEIRGLQQQLGAKPKGPDTATAPGWEVGAFGDRVTVGTDILFESGKATLTPAGKAKLDKIVADIKQHYGSKPIRVYGHTDSDPIRRTKDQWDDNLDLSLNRAAAVTRYLNSKGISEKQVETVGMGQWHPESSDKAKNRRVEIYVIKAPFPTTAPAK